MFQRCFANYLLLHKQISVITGFSVKHKRSNLPQSQGAVKRFRQRELKQETPPVSIIGDSSAITFTLMTAQDSYSNLSLLYEDQHSSGHKTQQKSHKEGRGYLFL